MSFQFPVDFSLIQAVLCLHGFLDNTVYFGTLICPFSTKSLLCLHGCFSKVSKNSVSRGSPVLVSMGNGERKSNFHMIHHVRSWFVLFMTKRHIATVKMKISLSTIAVYFWMPNDNFGGIKFELKFNLRPQQPKGSFTNYDDKFWCCLTT